MQSLGPDKTCLNRSETKCTTLNIMLTSFQPEFPRKHRSTVFFFFFFFYIFKKWGKWKEVDLLLNIAILPSLNHLKTAIRHIQIWCLQGTMEACPKNTTNYAPPPKKWRGIMLYPLKFWVSVRPSVCPYVHQHFHHSCARNSSYSFKPILFKLYRRF